MNQDQQPQPWWKDKRLVWALAALVLTSLVITTILGYWQRWASWFWTGLETKSSWDWLDLLIIPVVLAAGALWFNRQERKAQNAIETRRQELEQALAEDRAREEALQRYLDTMQDLILGKGLRRSEKDAEVRDVARVRTLAVLRSLDGDRKGQVARFLHEADLIGKVVREESEERQVIEAIIDLRTANLSSARLSHADLSGAYLSHADLSGAYLNRACLSEASLLDADLGGADLSNADLSGAILSSARLSNANLIGARLIGARLNHADLNHADLSYANLSYANLSGAYLDDADLSGAYLDDADLSGAILSGAKGWTNAQLAKAKSLVGAALSGRTRMTEEGWEKFKKEYPQ